MRALLKLRYSIEAGLIGLFFVQALRYLIGAIYGRVSSAVIFPAVNPALLDPDIPGLVPPATVTAELTLLGYMIALPILAVVLGRFRLLIFVAAGVAAVGRALMVVPSALTPTAAAAITVGGGLLYIAMLIRQRYPLLPYLFIVSFGADQVFRAFGNTFDPSWSPGYSTIQLVLSAVVVVLAALNLLRPTKDTGIITPGLMPFSSGLGLGALLFLEIALLSTPNAIAGRARTDYTLLVPFVVVATLLPLVPWVRGQARGFISLFDAGVRGWSWMLLVALLIVFGTRFQGIFAGVALVIAQFCVSMMWFWLARPQLQKERSVGGLWLVFAMLLFGLLVVFDLFTYEYAYVRDFAAPLAFLNDIVPPLLRGFRGLGLGVLLLSVFFAALPMIGAQRRVPWNSGATWQSVAALGLTAAAAGLAAFYARPPVVAAVRDVPELRIGTYNIHGGFNEFFYYDLDGIARTIYESGADVVLLQEVEAGRMTSFGVDQTLWLARRLGMDRRFYPTNEGLQGLAVLSRVEIVYDDGRPLTSVGSQTGLQRVQVRPDDGVITVYNTWLGILVEGVGLGEIAAQEQDQQRQLREIFGYITLDHPTGTLGRTVVGGTFNNNPDSDLLAQMRAAQFDDPFAGTPLVAYATFYQLSTDRRARWDYLLLRNLPKTEIGVMDTRASDHRMAVVKVLIE